jgi:hypothetical protein
LIQRNILGAYLFRQHFLNFFYNPMTWERHSLIRIRNWTLGAEGEFEGRTRLKIIFYADFSTEIFA